MALINRVLSDYTEGENGGGEEADSEEDGVEAIDTDGLPDKVLTSGGNGGGPYHYPPNHPRRAGHTASGGESSTARSSRASIARVAGALATHINDRREPGAKPTDGGEIHESDEERIHTGHETIQ